MTGPAVRGELLPGSLERRKVLLVCAPLTLLFTFADSTVLGGFPWHTFLVRLVWAGLIVAAALAWPRVTRDQQRGLAMGVAVGSAGFFALLAALTHGVASPLFHWIHAMPLAIALVLQDHPEATAGAALATIAGGLAIAVGDHMPPGMLLQWGVQAAAMAGLAVYASYTYRRLRLGEMELVELRAAHRAAEERVQARDEFLSIASHELRTPVTVLGLQVQTLLKGGGGKGEPLATRLEGKLDGMERQVGRLQHLIDNLFDVSRIHGERVDLELGEVDLAEVELVLPAGGVAVARCDQLRFEQSLENFVGNAVKFGAGKPITVEVAAEGTEVVVAVTDQGIGIAREDQDRIFERFERAASSRDYAGLGLGLWITRRMVEAMGGMVSVKSEPGAGARFELRLPRAEASSAVAL